MARSAPGTGSGPGVQASPLAKARDGGVDTDRAGDPGNPDCKVPGNPRCRIGTWCREKLRASRSPRCRKASTSGVIKARLPGGRPSLHVLDKGTMATIGYARRARVRHEAPGLRGTCLASSRRVPGGLATDRHVSPVRAGLVRAQRAHRYHLEGRRDLRGLPARGRPAGFPWRGSRRGRADHGGEAQRHGAGRKGDDGVAARPRAP